MVAIDTSKNQPTPVITVSSTPSLAEEVGIAPPKSGYPSGDLYVGNGRGAHRATRKRKGWVGKTLATGSIDGKYHRVTVEKMLGDPKGYANEAQAFAAAAGHDKASAVFRHNGRWYAVGTNVAKNGLDETAGRRYRRTPADIAGLRFVNLSATKTTYAGELAKARGAKTMAAAEKHWRNAAALALGVPPSKIHIVHRADAGDSKPGMINIALHRNFQSNGQLVDTDSGNGGGPRLDGDKGMPKRAVVLGTNVFRSDGGWKARETLMHEATHLENVDRTAAHYQRYMRSPKFKRAKSKLARLAGFQAWMYAQRKRFKGDERVRFERDLAMVQHYMGHGSEGADESLAYAAAFISSFPHAQRPNDRITGLLALASVGEESAKGGMTREVKQDIASRLETLYRSVPPGHQRAMLNELKTNKKLAWILPLWKQQP